MKKISLFIFAMMCVTACAAQFVTAQFNIKIPKINKPKVEQPKTDQPKTGDSGSTTKTATAKSGGKSIYANHRPTATPVLMKNSIYIQARVHDEYWKLPNERDHSSWVPMLRFNHFYNNDRQLNYTVEYFNPNGSAWYSEKLEQSGTSSADRMVSFESPSPYGEVFNTKSTNGTGIYSFKITDQDTKQILYQGKFKVGKVSRASRPTEKNKNDFYVEQDWLLPFGMIGFHHSDIEIGGIQPEVSVWLNGMVSADELEAGLFYKGQQIATSKERGGAASGYDERASGFAAPFAPHTMWKRWLFAWEKFRFDNGGNYNPDNYPGAHYADKNPGEYTVKIYRSGTQIRELNFTVGTDGKFVAPAYMEQISQPYHRVILPVKVIGTAEKVNAAAWKTDAFYGNPVSGFNVP